MVVCRRVFNLNEIATWFDRLTMSGCAPGNDSRPVWFDKVGTYEESAGGRCGERMVRQAHHERKIVS